MRKLIQPPAKPAKKEAAGRSIPANISEDTVIGKKPVNFNAVRPALERPSWATPRDGRHKPTKPTRQTGVGVPAPLD
jgi:hypothetical protein